MGHDIGLELGRDDVVRYLGEVGHRLVGIAENQAQLLVQGHCRERRLGARVGRQRGIEPGLVRGCRAADEQTNKAAEAAINTILRMRNP